MLPTAKPQIGCSRPAARFERQYCYELKPVPPGASRGTSLGEGALALVTHPHHTSGGEWDIALAVFDLSQVRLGARRLQLAKHAAPKQLINTLHGLQGTTHC